MPLFCYAQPDSVHRSMFEDTLQMPEFTISVKTAVRVHGDTTSYRVDSFYRDPLATTEDVLKRLPGVEVSRDGAITIDGKPVNKIFINNKEYLGESVKEITRNLPAEILEKIQVTDWKDEEEQLTGIDKDNDEKIINLQFKKKYEDGIYGRAGAGYGMKERYQAGVFGNYLSKNGANVTAIGNFNNTGMSDVASSNDNTNSRVYSRAGVREEQKGTINFSLGNSDKNRLNGSYRFSNSDNDLLRSSLRTTFLEDDSTLLQQQGNIQGSNTQQHNLSIRNKYSFNKKAYLRTTLSLSYSNQTADNRRTDTSYSGYEDNINYTRLALVKNTSRRQGFQLSNSFFKAFEKKGRSLVANYSIGYNIQSVNGRNDNYNQYYSPFIPSQVLNISEEDKSDINSNLSIRYTEPLSDKSRLSIKYDNNYSSANSDRLVQVENNGSYELDSNQSRSFKNINTINTIGVTYQYSTVKLTSGLGVDVAPYSIKSDRTGNAQDISQNGVNYYPEAYIRYTLSKVANINIRYNGSVNPPTITQLQPIPDYTDSLNIYIGNPTLSPELNNNLILRFNTNNHKKGKRFYTYIRVNWANNKIISSTQVTNSKRTTIPINADGNYTLSASASYSQAFVNKKLRSSVSLSGTLGNNVVVTNSVLQNIGNRNVQPKLSINYYSDNWYEGGLSYSYRWNSVESSANINNIFQTHDLTHDGTFTLPMGFRCSYYLVYMENVGLNQEFQQKFLLMNATLDKSFENIKGLSIRLQAFDILNNYPTVQRNVSDNYYEDVSVNRIGSYYMLSLVYRFTHFKQK